MRRPAAARGPRRTCSSHGGIGSCRLWRGWNRGPKPCEAHITWQGGVALRRWGQRGIGQLPRGLSTRLRLQIRRGADSFRRFFSFSDREGGSHAHLCMGATVVQGWMDSGLPGGAALAKRGSTSTILPFVAGSSNSARVRRSMKGGPASAAVAMRGECRAPDRTFSRFQKQDSMSSGLRRRFQN